MSIVPTGPVGLSTDTREMNELHEPEKIRQMSQQGDHPGMRQRLWGLEARLDPNVTFEEYTYWAKIEREMEDQEQRQRKHALEGQGPFSKLKACFRRSKKDDVSNNDTATPKRMSDEMTDYSSSTEEKPPIIDKESSSIEPIAPSSAQDLDADWRRAARALRTTGWITVFYLITTDIIGWSQTPYVFASCGYGLGAGIFVLFGIAAMCSGLMIWRTFLTLDSSRFPVLSFGDPYFRLFGAWARNFINIAQAFQMFCSVAVILMSNSQILSQLAQAKVCYIAIVIINMVIGMASGWLKALKQLGWICNFAVWFNIASFIIIAVCAALKGPDTTVPLQITLLKEALPVKTFAGTPPAQYQQQTTDIFAAQFNGIDTIVYSFSGALLFVAFMSEMRHPMDFWKGCLLAQIFITLVYLFFGVFVYTYYGQYAITNITQVVNPYSLQIVCNVLALITGYLAVFLYFHVGMKTVYLEVGEQIFGLPPITEKKGYYIWLGLGPVYWILAMVLAVSVPNFTAITNLIGGLLSLNFTYSFPAIMYGGLIIQQAAALPGEGFDPRTGVTTRHDNGWKRHIRGLRQSWYISIPTILFAMGGLASSGMGSWSAILSLQQIFGPGGTIQTSWGCTAIG